MSEVQNSTTSKKMSTGVKVAIGCGLLIVVAVIGVIAVSVLGIVGVAKVADEVVTSIEDEQAEMEKAEQESFDNPYKLGEVVTIDDVEWTLVEAQNIGSTIESSYGDWGDDCVANSGTFVKVKLKMKNNSASMVTVTDLYIYDSSKREFIPSTDVYSCVEEELFLLDNINPGIEKTFVAVYEIPAGAEGLRMKAGNLDLFKSGHKYISLGF